MGAAEPRATLSSKPRYFPTPHPARPSGPESTLDLHSPLSLCLCTGFGDPSPAARWAAVLQANGRPFSTGTWGSPYRPPLPSINADTWKTCLCVCIPGATVQGCGQGPDARPRRALLGVLTPGHAGTPSSCCCQPCCLLPWSGRGALRGALLDSPLSSSADVQPSSLVLEQVSRNRGPQGESLSWFRF